MLEIEKGKYTYVKPKVPLEQRLYKVCSLDKIEDEYNFLCVYPLYQDLRQEFYVKQDNLGLSGNNFTDVLNCSVVYHFFNKAFKVSTNM